MKLSQKGLLLVASILMVQLIIVFCLMNSMAEAEREAEREAKAKEIVGRTNGLIHKFYDAGTSLKGYISSIDPEASQKYKSLMKEIPSEIAWLKTAMKENKKAFEAVKRIEKRAEKTISLLQNARRVTEDGSLDDIQQTVKSFRDELQPTFDSLILDVDVLVDSQQHILKESPALQAKARAGTRTFLYSLIGLNVMVALALALFFLRNITRKVDLIVDNTRRLAAGKPLNQPLSSKDELGHLDRIFHQMSRELEEARRKERAIFKNVQDVICAFDADGKLIEASSSALNLWGETEEEILGRRFADLIIPAEQSHAWDKFLQAKEGTILEPFEARVKLHGGEKPIDVLWTVQWAESEKTFFCVAHDITDRKRAEELIKANEVRIRTIIESMPVGVFVTTQEGTIDYVNPMSQALFKSNASELLGKHIQELFPEIKEDLISKLKDSAEGKITELHATSLDGKRFPSEISVGRFETHEGARLLIIILDITERYELQKMKQSFVAMVSHELRTPLTSVQNFLGMLNMGILGDLSEKAKRLGGSAERSVNRLITLINDLLDAEKLEQGKVSLTINDTNTQEILEASLEALEGFAQKHNVVLNAQKENFELKADANRISQVLINLVSNAVKFSPPESVVNIELKKEKDEIEFKVIDKGEGIPEPDQALVFERFHQAGESKTAKIKGTGLGLAIAKAIIVGHGGTIGVNSIPGEGATFWFRIPVSGPNETD